MPSTALYLDAIRSRPIISLTAEEIGQLSEKEQRWAFDLLRRPDRPWPYSARESASRLPSDQSGEGL